MPSMDRSKKQIGAYCLLSELGRGGMGTVYLAEHVESGQVVALKTVRLARRKLLSQFRREIHALSNIRHPGIVTIIEQGVHRGRPWYAMEYVTGTTLREYLHLAHPRSHDDLLTHTREENSQASQEDSLHSLDPLDPLDSQAYEIEWLQSSDKSLPPPQGDKSLPPPQGEAGDAGQTASDVTTPDLTPPGDTKATPLSASGDTEATPLSASGERVLYSWEIPDAQGGTRPTLLPDLPRSLSIVQGLCTTLAYLHGEGTVHCDLKPENIILQDDGWPVLIDFGLLVQFAGGVNREVLELGHEGSGTLPYMSPEQINGELLDARADIYSLGCILYELLVGQPPFVGERFDIVSQHMFSAPTPPSHRNPHLPPELDALILHMLAKERHERIGYADVVGARLVEIEPRLRQRGAFRYLEHDRDGSIEPDGIPRLRPQWSDDNDESASAPRHLHDTLPEGPHAPVDRDRLFDLPTIEEDRAVEAGEETIPLPEEGERSPAVVIARRQQRTQESHQSLPLPRVYLYRPSLFGRRESWNTLKQQVDRLRQKQSGGLALISGESGLGKTRLILELSQYARSKQVQIITSRCVDRRTPALSLFHPFLEAVNDQLREHQGFAPLLWEADAADGSATDQPLPTEPEKLVATPSVGPTHVHHRMVQTLQQSLASYSEKHPLLFLIDDLHWADESSLSALAYLARPDALPRVLFVGAYRSEERPVALQMLVAQKSVQHIELQTLHDDDIEAAISDMLAMPEVPAPLTRTLVRYAEGNPYFVAEYLHTAVAEGLLKRDVGGQWQVDPLLTGEAPASDSPDSLSLHVPHSLRALMLRRIAQLSPEARMVLAIAAVLDDEATLSLTQAVSRLPTKKWWQILEHLQRLLILEENTEEMLRFVHGQFRDTVYAELSAAARAMYHRRVAETMEEYWSHRRDQHASTLAYHWHCANHLPKAGSYYQHAAQTAQAHHDTDEAIRLYRLALQTSPDDDDNRLSLQLQITELLLLRGELELAHDEIERALATAREHHNRKAEADLLLRLATLQWHRGQREISRQITEEALQLYRQLGDSEGEGSTLASLGHCYFTQSRWQEAQSHYREAMVLYRNTGDQPAQGQMMVSLAKLAMRQGRLVEARDLCLNALSIFHDHSAERLEGMALWQLAQVHILQERLDLAQRQAQRALSLFQNVGDRFHEGMALATLAQIHGALGQLHDALQLYHESIQLHESIDNHIFAAIHRVQRVGVERMMGHPLAPLENELDTIEPLLQESRDPLVLSILACERGHLALAHGKSAHAFVRQARRILTSSHLDPHAPTEASLRLRRLHGAQTLFAKDQPLVHGESLNN